MKFSLLHKATAFLLSALVLFTSVSHTVEKHFCNDVLVDITVFSKAKPCCGNNFDSENVTVSEPSCCKNEITAFERIAQLSSNVLEKESITTEAFNTSYVFYGYQHTFLSQLHSKQELVCYKPPKHTVNKQRLYEQYLI